jgi:hypothetical protein
VRFSDHVTGEVAVRQPLTVGALLETSAVWSELKMKEESLAFLGEDERVVEVALWTRQLREYMYNPHLTEYTAPAHILSASCGIGEVLSTYERAALLAQIAFNLPKRLLSYIKIEGFPDGVNDKFRQLAEPGFIYAALCRSAPKSTPDAVARESLERTLSSANLPSRAEILAEASENMRTLLNELPPNAAVLRLLIKIGLQLHEARSREADPAITFERLEQHKLTMPPLFDTDGEIFFISERYPDPIIWHAVEMFEAEARLHSWLVNFLPACH